MTGLPTSRVYRTVMNVWRGDHDYLGYLQTILRARPARREGGAVINEAIEYTQRAQDRGHGPRDREHGAQRRLALVRGARRSGDASSHESGEGGRHQHRLALRDGARGEAALVLQGAPNAPPRRPGRDQREGRPPSVRSPTSGELPWRSRDRTGIGRVTDVAVARGRTYDEAVLRLVAARGVWLFFAAAVVLALVGCKKSIVATDAGPLSHRGEAALPAEGPIEITSYDVTLGAVAPSRLRVLGVALGDHDGAGRGKARGERPLRGHARFSEPSPALCLRQDARRNGRRRVHPLPHLDRRRPRARPHHVLPPVPGPPGR